MISSRSIVNTGVLEIWAAANPSAFHTVASGLRSKVFICEDSNQVRGESFRSFGPLARSLKEASAGLPIATLLGLMFSRHSPRTRHVPFVDSVTIFLLRKEQDRWTGITNPMRCILLLFASIAGQLQRNYQSRSDAGAF